MEIRHNIITGEPVIFAPERAARPSSYATTDPQAVTPPCPFCPGNESGTPPEIDRTGDPWRVRVFPNKYPFAAPHEVIVEAAEHDATFEGLTHAPEVVSTYLRRVEQLYGLADIAHVALFKNHGRNAGASLQHLHSQVAALTFVPPRIQRELQGFGRATACPLCTALRRNVVAENASFVVIAPHPSSFASELWVVPASHRNRLASLRSGEVADLAEVLQAASQRIAAISSDHNWLLMTFPDERGHAYFELVPRTSPIAGFEIATGTFIDSGPEAR